MRGPEKGGNQKGSDAVKFSGCILKAIRTSWWEEGDGEGAEELLILHLCFWEKKKEFLAVSELALF